VLVKKKKKKKFSCYLHRFNPRTGRRDCLGAKAKTKLQGSRSAWSGCRWRAANTYLVAGFLISRGVYWPHVVSGNRQNKLPIRQRRQCIYECLTNPHKRKCGSLPAWAAANCWILQPRMLITQMASHLISSWMSPQLIVTVKVKVAKSDKIWVPEVRKASPAWPASLKRITDV